jgi:hypothetical protein
MPLPVEYVCAFQLDCNPLGDGKLESEVLPLEETILIMEIMDRVRQMGGLKYPERIDRY